MFQSLLFVPAIRNWNLKLKIFTLAPQKELGINLRKYAKDL